MEFGGEKLKRKKMENHFPDTAAESRKVPDSEGGDTTAFKVGDCVKVRGEERTGVIVYHNAGTDLFEVRFNRKLFDWPRFFHASELEKTKQAGLREEPVKEARLSLQEQKENLPGLCGVCRNAKFRCDFWCCTHFWQVITESGIEGEPVDMCTSYEEDDHAGSKNPG